MTRFYEHEKAPAGYAYMSFVSANTDCGKLPNQSMVFSLKNVNQLVILESLDGEISEIGSILRKC